MSAYVILNIEVTDPQMYETYKEMAAPTVAAYGGRYIVRGGQAETVEGDWSPKRLVVLAFDSVAQAHQWLHSPEYSAAKKIRHQAAVSQAVIVEGVEEN
jgi:uncharacterized protein (DUF1330 family)